MKIAFRGFTGTEKLFEETINVEPGDDLGSIVRSHLERLPPEHMIEMEFIDWRGIREDRFFRVGTDSSGMLLPLRVL